MSFSLSLTFSLQQNWRRGWNRLCPEKMAQTMYTHVSKCKNEKRRKEKKNKYLSQV
jgi:hypothetical protein